MPYLILLLALAVASPTLSAQSVLTGVLTDRTTDQPVPDATIFVDGTNIVSRSDADGNFRLALGEARPPYRLAVRHQAFEIPPFRIATAAQPLVIRLAPRRVADTALPPISRSDLHLIKNYFIGRDDWLVPVELQNPEVLGAEQAFPPSRATIGSNAAPTSRRDRRTATRRERLRKKYAEPIGLSLTATAPLVIDNPYLGYRIHLDLMSAYHTYRGKVTDHTGTVSFADLLPNDTAGRLQTITNRELAYWGSALHFLRALTDGRLADNGFTVREKVVVDFGTATELIPADPNADLERQADGTYVLVGWQGRELIIDYTPENNRFRTRRLRNRSWPHQLTLRIANEREHLHPAGYSLTGGLRFSGQTEANHVSYWLPVNYRPH